MTPAMIVFTAIYCVVLCLYFYTETSGNLKLRAPNKIALALGFFIFGTVYACIGRYNDDFSRSFFITSLFLTMLGDIALLFSFKTGAHFFMAGNISFAAFNITVLTKEGLGISNLWFIIPVALVLFSIYPLLHHFYPKAFNFGKDTANIYMYMSTIVTSGTVGIAVTAFIPSLRLYGIGFILFMLSDFDIIIHKFVLPKNKWVHRLNSALYFTGLLLIVLNVAMIA